MRYSAFLSYSRADDGAANWLHRQLDRYRTPRRLVGTAGAQGAILAKLHPIFRDRTDMAGGGRLTDRIKQALEYSDRLIVLCSPAAARSLWVEQEVQTFIGLHSIERVFPVVAPDLPETDDIERDYFPFSLRNRGLLAADLREIRTPGSSKVVGDGRETGRVKLIAGLLGVGLDQLAQREKQRQRLLLSGAVLAACVFAVVAALAIWQSTVAIRNERAANENVARVFVERAKRTLDSGDIALSAKYALAGVTIAPSVREEQQPILADTLHRGGPISGALPLQVPIRGLGLSFHGDSVALVDERGMVGLQSRDGRLEWSRSAHDLAGSHLTVTDDGKFVASSGNDGTVQIFDLKTGAPKGEPLVQEVATAFTVFSATGGELLVVGESDHYGRDTPISFYKVGSAAPVWATKMAGDVVAARIIPDGREIVLIDGEGTVLRLDSANGNVVGSRRVLTLGERRRVIIDKPGRVAFVGSDGVLTAVSLDDGKVLFRRELTPSGPITAIAVGTTILAFGDVFGRIFILSLRDGRLLANGHGHGADVSHIYISGDEKVIASATDHFIRFWRPGWATFRAQYDGDARLALSRDQTRLAVATASHVQVLQLTDVGETSRFPLQTEERPQRPLALTFTEDDRGLLILQATGRLLRLNLDSGAVQVVELGEKLWQGDVHRNGTVAVVREDDHTVVEIHQGTRRDRVAVSEASSVSKVRFSDNGEGLVAVTHSGDVIVWDVVEKRDRYRARHPDSPKQVPGMRSIGSFSVIDTAPTAALSPDGKIAAWTDIRNQRIHLLRLDRHRAEEAIPLERGAMGALAFSETGNQLASAGSDYGAVFDVHSKYPVATYQAPATDILLTSKVGLIVGAFEWTEKGTGNKLQSATVIWHDPLIFAPSSALVEKLCSDYLGAGSDRFTERETSADALIQNVWSPKGSRTFCSRGRHEK